uniref:hypothetical protein n=1 Tax=Candidatus Thiodubiliella endoseptemdiera TaxID=2738886 RepID=UPI0034DEC922
MKKIVFILVGLLAGNAFAKPINHATFITHSYKLDRKGLWGNPAVENTLRDTEKTNAILGLSGDISGFEYQLKYQIDTKKTTIQSLFYIADINDDLSVQMGKFIENWQLGYAFSPLAVTDPYHPINNDDELNQKLGINAIAMRYSMENSYLDLYISDDKKPRDTVHGYGYKSQGVRLNYILNDETDLTFIAHKKETVKTGFGVGFRHIATDNVKLYGAFFTRKGTTIPSEQSENRTNNDKRYTRAMLGWHWVSDNNTSIIAEISQDDRGMNTQEWQTYKTFGLTTGLNLSLVRPNGLRQRYHFLRLGKKFNTHELSLSRRTSTDNSALNTLKWKNNITENLQLTLSHSTATGTPASEYKAYFPDQNQTSLVLRYSFDF